jgi:hypothetical protein
MFPLFEFFRLKRIPDQASGKMKKKDADIFFSGKQGIKISFKY